MLVRHPQTVSNGEGRYVGRLDSPVTEIGQAQVRWLARVVAAWEPEMAFSSPLGRALSTAHAITPAGVPLQVLDELQEVDFGQAEGHTHAELETLGIRFDYEGGGPIAPGGESGDALRKRVVAAAGAIEAAGKSRTLVVTHGGILRQMLVHWLDLPVMSAWRFGVPNGAVALVRVTDGVGLLHGLTPPPDDPSHQGPRRRRPWHF